MVYFSFKKFGFHFAQQAEPKYYRSNGTRNKTLNAKLSIVLY